MARGTSEYLDRPVPTLSRAERVQLPEVLAMVVCCTFSAFCDHVRPQAALFTSPDYSWIARSPEFAGRRNLIEKHVVLGKIDATHVHSITSVITPTVYE